MLISVVIPVYNVKEYLNKCVDSVLANDCADCEIILVDDGSTDGVCPEICDDYERSYPELIKAIHKQNGGLGDARNVGVEHSNGEYVLFVDSDDYIEPDMLACLKEAIDTYRADAVAFGYRIVEGDIKTDRLDSFLPEKEPLTLAENKRMLFAAPNAVTKLWRREFLLETGITYPSRVWYEDIRTTLKLIAKAKSVVYIHRPFYNYLVRDGSITHNANIRRNREIIDAFEDLVVWYREKGLFEKYRDELCKLCIDHLYIAGSVRVIRAEPKNALTGEFRDYIEREFPNYMQNPYLCELPRLHKLILKLLNRKKYKTIGILFAVKDKLKRG